MTGLDGNDESWALHYAVIKNDSRVKVASPVRISLRAIGRVIKCREKRHLTLKPALQQVAYQPPIRVATRIENDAA